MPHKDLPLPPFPLVVLDTETTGFVPRVHRVIEFASSIVRDGKVEKEYEQLIAAEEIPPVVQVITRIRPEHLAGKPTFDEKREEILAHIPEDAVVVGQNVNFDIGMLKGEGIDLSGRPMLDTSMLASLVYPELESYSLGYLSRVLTLDHSPQHRALGDVRATLELLSRCWERLCELPAAAREDALRVAAKAPPGLRMFLGALPKAKATKAPSWFAHVAAVHALPSEDVATIEPPPAEVQLSEESLDPAELQHVIRGALRGKGPRTWIALKNLRVTLERLPAELLQSGVRVLYPPHLLLDAAAKEALVAQEALTNDEATLALKLLWFPTEKRTALPLHGGEEAVWNGKLAATTASPAYAAQFQDLPRVVLLEHRDLLQLLDEPDQPGHEELLRQPSHVIVDDASMLEDTATKAYGWYVSVETLRAAAQGEALLTKFLDTFQLWIERTRQFQDLRYLAPNDLASPEAKGLRTLLQEVLEGREWSAHVRRTLGQLQKILEPANLAHRIAYIEQNRQGNQYVQSVPERIGLLLKEKLFSRVPTTLLIPSGAAGMLPEILPAGHEAPVCDKRGERCAVTVSASFDIGLQDLLENPPTGKTILLLGSRSQIDDAFVKHTERLEEKGVALICQGSSGGQGRMQSEFLSAPGSALWLLTPWMFEGVDLPPGTVNLLVLASLPFDHPSHAVLSRRAQSYRDPFNEYSLPRLLHRLFRLLRTFCRFRAENGSVLLIDDRLQTKSYGRKILSYLEAFATDEAPAPAAESNTLVKIVAPKAEKPKKPKTAKAKKAKGDESQMAMF